MQQALTFLTTLCLFTLLLSGCATTGPFQSGAPPLKPQPLKPGDIIDTKTGGVISFDSLMTELSKAKVVYVGETHTSAEDHEIQLKIAKALFAANPSLALAMEMFPSRAQPVLDRYTQGLLTEDDFVRESEWEKVWGYPFQLYRGLTAFAAEKRLKIIGLNIPHEIVRKISRNGLSSLNAEERSQVALDIDYDDIEHRNYIQEEFEQHIQGSIKDFDTFYEAQLAWEESMAETLADFLEASGAETKVLVIIGKGHMSYRFGAPQRTARRVNHVYKTIAPFPYNHPDRVVDPKLADYVWLTEKLEPSQRARLGVMVRETEKGLEVLSLMPDSPAAKAGIRKGDIIEAVDGAEVRKISELHEALAQEKKVLEITLKRGRNKISVTAAISQ